MSSCATIKSFKEVKIENLKPFPDNSLFPASRETIENLKKEIQTHGFQHPISITPNNTILSGHKRVQACKELGFDTIPAFMVDVSKDDEFLYFLRQNTIPEQITRDIRIQIYKRFLKEVFVGRAVKEEKINKISSRIGIPKHIIVKDIAFIRKGNAPKVSVDILTDIWRKKLANPKINFALTEKGWICKIQDRNFETSFGPTQEFKLIAKIVFDAGLSRHFETKAISETAIELGNEIKRIREYYSVSQVELAQKLGKSQSTLCEWETAKIHLTRSHVEKVEKACQEIAGVSVRD
jgi:ParB/RepB/Spo0J family partition protein